MERIPARAKADEAPINRPPQPGCVAPTTGYNPRALNPTGVLGLQRTVGNRAAGRAIASGAGPQGQEIRADTPVQREMKFEIQTTNKVFRNDGTTVTPLERKYGPEDFLFRGSSGVRLESETRGVLEFETNWSKKWSKLREEIVEAVEMTKTMNGAADVGSGRKKFPFEVPHLRTGTKSEMKSGVWKRRKGYEGSGEKILRDDEMLEIEVKDSSWNSGIQSSEGILLVQYESLLKQHEWKEYRDPVIANADDIVNQVRPTGKSAPNVDNLRSFVQILVDYIMRGQGGEASKKAGAFASVKGMPSKQAFTLMSRTNFASIYLNLLSKTERKLYRTIVRDKLILNQMGLDTKTPFFVEGYGAHGHHAGPTVHAWLKGIHGGTDLLSSQQDGSLSSAMGKHNVETKAGKKDTKLVKFETRNTVLGAWKTAAEWEKYAHDLFTFAAKQRKRATGKDETGLEL